jgi:holliday junction DNA helicase RuvA
MIGLLKGVVIGVGENAALIDVHGVGYVVEAGSRTLGRLTVGEGAVLHIDTYVREDALRLFGFLSDDEKAWFTHLQTVQGVGAKVALALLDTLAPVDLMEAVALKDTAAIARTPGVGPKLASRLVLELKGKLPSPGLMSSRPGAFTAPSAAAGGDATRREALSDMGRRNEAISALVNLGYGQSDALRAVSAAYRTFSDDPPVSDLVRVALKEISK